MCRPTQPHHTGCHWDRPAQGLLATGSVYLFCYGAHENDNPSFYGGAIGVISSLAWIVFTHPTTTPLRNRRIERQSTTSATHIEPCLDQKG